MTYAATGQHQAVAEFNFRNREIFENGRSMETTNSPK
jgi:hypothetical protein